MGANFKTKMKTKTIKTSVLQDLNGEPLEFNIATADIKKFRKIKISARNAGKRLRGALIQTGLIDDI